MLMAMACAAGTTVDAVTGSSSSAPLTSARARPCWPANTPGIRRGIGVRRTAETSSTANATANCAHARYSAAARAASTTWSLTSPASRSGSRSSGLPMVAGQQPGHPDQQGERTRRPRRRIGGRASALTSTRSGWVWVGGSCQGAPVVVPCRGIGGGGGGAADLGDADDGQDRGGSGGAGGDGDGGPGDGDVAGDAGGGEDRARRRPGRRAGFAVSPAGVVAAEGCVVEGVGAGPGRLLGGVGGPCRARSTRPRRPAPARPAGPARRS